MLGKLNGPYVSGGVGGKAKPQGKHWGYVALKVNLAETEAVTWSNCCLFVIGPTASKKRGLRPITVTGR